MDIASFTGIIVLAGLFGIIGGVMLSCHDDGKPHALWYKLKCKLGRHTMAVRGVKRIRCQGCGLKRSHPHLKVIDGAKKDRSRFKF